MNISKKEGKKFHLYLFLLAIFIFIILSGLLIKAEDSEHPSLSEWRMFGRYLNHTAWDGADFPIISGLNSSSFQTGTTISWSSPTVFNGYVFIGGEDGNLYQLNASNISQKINNFTMSGIEISPAVVTMGSNSYVYVGGSGGSPYTLRQLNASNISQQIAASASGVWYSSPVIANGSVYFGARGASIVQLNASDISQQIASFYTVDIYATPAVANGYVYVAGGRETQNNVFYQLNASNISQEVANYSIPSGWNGRSSPVVWDEYVYFGTERNTSGAGAPGMVYQLNASNISQQIANYSTGSSKDRFGASSPAIATIGSDTYLYIGGGYEAIESIFQLNASNISQKIANYTIGNVVASSPTIANGYVYVGCGDGYVYQLNASNVSNFVGKIYAGSAINPTPAYANGYIYFASWNGAVYQVNASNLSLFVINDTTSPAVSIHVPSSTRTYSETFPISISMTEQGYCEYSIDGGITNHTLSTNDNTYFHGTSAVVSDGSYVLNAYCNDTAGNRNDTATRSFTMYTTPTTPTPGGGIVAGQPTQTHTWDVITENEPATMPIIVPEIHLIEITVVTIETLTGVSLTVTKIDVTPQSDILIRADGENYQGFKIDTTKINETNIANVTIEFKVNKTWLQELNLTYEDVSLYRKPGTPNIWDPLNTTFVDEDSEYYYFFAVSPGFSTFVIFIGTKPCNPGDMRCFNNELQLCVGDYTWVITKKCRGSCENNECVGRSIIDISSGSLLVYIVIVVLTAGLLVVLYFVFRFLSKKRSQSVWKGSKRTEVQHKI